MPLKIDLIQRCNVHVPSLKADSTDHAALNLRSKPCRSSPVASCTVLLETIASRRFSQSSGGIVFSGLLKVSSNGSGARGSRKTPGSSLVIGGRLAVKGFGSVCKESAFRSEPCEHEPSRGTVLPFQ